MGRQCKYSVNYLWTLLDMIYEIICFQNNKIDIAEHTCSSDTWILDETSTERPIFAHLNIWIMTDRTILLSDKKKIFTGRQLSSLLSHRPDYIRLSIHTSLFITGNYQKWPQRETPHFSSLVAKLKALKTAPHSSAISRTLLPFPKRCSRQQIWKNIKRPERNMIPDTSLNVLQTLKPPDVRQFDLM